MSPKHVLVALALAAAFAAPAAASDLAPAEVTLHDIFAEPELILPAGDAPADRSTCVEGQKFWLLTGVCCSAATRQVQEEQVCSGGSWVPTGRTRCFPPSCLA